MNGPGGFAAMISDYIFGPSSNYPRKLADVTQVRPGDIIIKKLVMPNGTVLPNDVLIALSTVTYENGMPAVLTCAGGHNKEVVWWDEPGASLRLDTYTRGQDNSQIQETVILTRYPEGGS